MSGLLFALQVILRLLAASVAIGVAYLTTPPDDLLADLERRGLGRRAVFVVGTALATVPRTVERAREIIDSQRARGLDTEGRVWRRARGVVPLVGPMLLGSLSEVEERTLALEARAFSAPGRRTLLRVPRDTLPERIGRPVLLTLAIGAIILNAAGRVTLP
jgi:energy-coupling factor transport system permease protein